MKSLLPFLDRLSFGFLCLIEHKGALIIIFSFPILIGLSTVVSKSTKMVLSPLATFGFPQTTPGSHKNLGYSFIQSPPRSPWHRDTPKYKETSKSALRIDEVAYSVYYPCSEPVRGWFGWPSGWTQWLPDPVAEVITGYQQFLGKRGAGWLCKFIGHVKDQ